MSEEQLYKLARQRVNRNTRRVLLLGLNILGFLLFVGAFAGFAIVPRSAGVFISVAWMGLIVLHVLLLGVLEYRKEAIESEVAKLREMIYEEKPKRLELGEDGELIDEIDGLDEQAYQRRGDSI